MNEQFVFARLIDSLPHPEDDVTRQTLSVFTPLTRDVLVSQLSTGFNLLSEEWKREGEGIWGGAGIPRGRRQWWREAAEVQWRACQ